MRKSLLLALCVVSLLSAVGARAQSPNFNVGPVWRVTYFHIKSGQTDAFWNDVRQHGKPVLEEQKKQGLITDYKYYTNPVLNHPGDWDVAVAISYPNRAAIDQRAAKGFTIAEKHYGSREAINDAARKRDDIR